MPNSRSEATGVNLAEPKERLILYPGRSLTSFVLLEAEKSAEVVVGEANRMANEARVGSKRPREAKR